MVIGLGVAGAIMLAYPGFKWVYMTQKGLHPQTDPWEHIDKIEAPTGEVTVSSGANHGVIAGRDVSGHQVTAGGDVYIGVTPSPTQQSRNRGHTT
jgi:hypothetical protein